MLKPTSTCAYTFYLDTESPAAFIELTDTTGINQLLASPRKVVDTSGITSSSRVTGATNFEHASRVTYSLLANVSYDIRVHYTAPNSAGPDPATGEAILEPTERRLVLSWSCPGNTVLYKKKVIDAKYLLHRPDPAINFNLFAAMTQAPPPYTLSMFGRAMDAISSSVLDWDQRVTWPIQVNYVTYFLI